MATPEKKILWIFPSNKANVLLGALIVTLVVALLWSYVMALGFSDNAWVEIIEWILLAVIIGGAVGMFAGNSNQSTLWIAAGFASVGAVLTTGLGMGGEAGYNVGDSLRMVLTSPEIALTVGASVGAIVLGIIAASAATAAAKPKM